ncbi:BTAD domain-containing putative transcriptional regulator [Aquipuribacter nitratireducens]|uniref:BTAD domain-containing putative transcriptional regulator n=1 Tax=Aquipuribacter nitratireducens TaxID=650104 RepID=A0ABW0GIK2_9MICO
MQICVARLRKALGRRAVETVRGGYRVDAGVLDLDVDDFEELLRRGRDLADAGEADRAVVLFDRALGVWRGDPFPGLDGWLPALAESARLQELHRSTEEALLDARLAVGQHREVAADAETLVAEQPLRERRWVLLALAQYRCGRQADALATLRRARRLLRDELGVDAGEDITALETAVLRQDAALRVLPRPRPVAEHCPYKGLAHHDVGDDLFGRDADVAACLARLRETPVLVVTGPSGCGKSSLLRAGLVPALRRSGSQVDVLAPGTDGVLAVPATGPATRKGTAHVLVVDQLEEAVGPGATGDGVTETLARLVEHVRGGGSVVVAVRVDRLAALTGYPPFGRLAERGLHLLTPLDGDALREVIVRPAAEVGLRLEPGLVELLVRDVEGEPGALPLLSHALVETWRLRDGPVLTVAAYRASGGIRGAVARSADTLFEGLTASQRTALRAVLLRLVGPSPDGDPVRRRIPLDSVNGDGDREHVVSLLVRARLLTVEDGTVEMSHESLAREWPRLRTWLEEHETGSRTLRHLGVAADGWESLGRPDTELYRGGRLETVLEYCDSARPALSAVERDFLDASRAHAESERRVLQRRALEDARRAGRLRLLLAGTSGLLVVALVAGVLAVTSAREAREQRDTAVAARSEAALQGLVTASGALRSSERDVAALLAVEAFRRWPDDVRARDALLGTFTADPGFLGNRYLPARGSVLGAVHPAAAQAAVVVVDGETPVRLDLGSGDLAPLGPATGGPSPEVPGPTERLAVSGDGRRVAVLGPGDAGADCDLASGRDSGCGRAVVLDATSGRLLLGPLTLPFAAGQAALDHDGALLAVAGGTDGGLVVHRVADGARTGAVDGSVPVDDDPWLGDAAAVAFDADGRIWLGSLGTRLRVLDAEALEVVRTVDVPPRTTNQHLVVLGEVVVGGGNAGLVAVDGAGVRWQQDLRGTHPDPCPALTASEAHTAVWCGSHFGRIEQFDLGTGAPTGADLDPQLGAVASLGVTADARELVAFGGEVPVVSRWRLDGSGPVASLVAEGHALADGYDPSGAPALLVSDRDSGTDSSSDFRLFSLWDPGADREVSRLDVVRAASMEGVGWLGRGTLAGMRLPQLRFGWIDVETGELAPGEEIGPECDHLWASGDGHRGYCGFLDGDVWTLDAATRRRTGPVISSHGEVRSVSATAGGDLVVVTAVTSEGATTTVHDGPSGRVVAGPSVGPSLTSVSPRGLLAGATGGDVGLYDLRTLERLADLPGARGEVNSLQFSRDGAILLATSNDQTVSVYDVATGRRLGDPIPTDAPLSYPGYLRPDGRAIAVTDERGVVVWDLDPARHRAAACQVAGRNLTRAEWAAHLGAVGPYRATCPGLPVDPSPGEGVDARP